MRPSYHIAVSTILCLLIFRFTESIFAGLIALASGIFIDLDHLIDFWYSQPENPLSIKAFLDSDKYLKKTKRIFVPLHSWEILFILIVVTYSLGWPLLLSALCLSIGIHLVFDLFFNKTLHPLTYFLTYRISKKFKIVKEWQ